jgi:DNA-binding response OmpR family regulator
MGSETPPERGNRPTILAVDDSPESLDVLVEILQSEFAVKVAPSGEQALRIVASGNPPDLVLLDVLMPGLSGYEVCRALKESPDTAGIPVIFVTSMDAPEDEVRGFELGAVDYIVKPFDPPVVLARIKTRLARAEQDSRGPGNDP